MYRFNRIYLLSSLILSYTIPFITFTVQAPKTNHPQLVIEEAAQYVSIVQTKQENFNWTNVVWIIYVMVTLFILIKSFLAIITIKRIQGEKRIYQNYNIIFTQKNLFPFSFWNTIYMGKEYLKNDIIDPRIFLHEKSHLSQMHSIDLILIHLVKTFTWFNPALFLYKNAIISNHEFLADEAVLKNQFNLKEYQNLILDELMGSQNIPFTHSLNFNNTKKRFIMMKAQKTKFSLLRKTVGIITLVAATVLLSERTYANISVKSENNTDLSTNIHKKTTNTEAPKVVQYFMKSIPEDLLQKNNPATPITLKKESVKSVTDTISPKKNQEGKNTNNKEDTNFVSAEYPGSMADLRDQIGKIMDVSALQPIKGVIKATAYIHIDQTGKATNVTTSGDNDIFNKEFLKTMTAISNDTNWKPATKDGHPIASVLKVPATMNFTQP
ncbi:beta-lactamase regulating signal transducer with metallopeptidase domain [Chryseobacterium jejuense]|nr:beta-lactamase regulating signal transducer with metallopeptidase domain [Chryseobacterium jejuense]